MIKRSLARILLVFTLVGVCYPSIASNYVANFRSNIVAFFKLTFLSRDPLDSEPFSQYLELHNDEVGLSLMTVETAEFLPVIPTEQLNGDQDQLISLHQDI